jgi:hypothetical protein
MVFKELMIEDVSTSWAKVAEINILNYGIRSGISIKLIENRI